MIDRLVKDLPNLVHCKQRIHVHVCVYIEFIYTDYIYIYTYNIQLKTHVRRDIWETFQNKCENLREKCDETVIILWWDNGINLFKSEREVRGTKIHDDESIIVKKRSEVKENVFRQWDDIR